MHCGRTKVAYATCGHADRDPKYARLYEQLSKLERMKRQIADDSKKETAAAASGLNLGALPILHRNAAATERMGNPRRRHRPLRPL